MVSVNLKLKALVDVDLFCLSESDSGSEDDSNVNSSNTFYSLYESRIKQKLSTQSKGQSSFALNLHIGHGLLSMFTPVRDQATNVIPNQQGEFTVTVEDATVFTVSGYNGDENLGYVCLQVGNAQLYHCGGYSFIILN